MPTVVRSCISHRKLDRKLLEAEPGGSVHTLAQARTSAAILRLDAKHNENLTHFLITSDLSVRSKDSARLLRRLMCNSSQRRRSPDRMMHQTLSKGWCRHGSGLLLGLIVRPNRRLVDARARFAVAQKRSSCPAQRSGSP